MQIYRIYEALTLQKKQALSVFTSLISRAKKYSKVASSIQISSTFQHQKLFLGCYGSSKTIFGKLVVVLLSL